MPGFETICAQAGAGKDSTFNSVTTPIYFTSTFSFDAPEETKGYDYSRSGNPTRAALEECLAEIEGGARAVATATGMAAETTVMHLFRAGDHIIAAPDIYAGTYRLFTDLLTDRGLEFSFVDMREPENVARAIAPATKAIWIETPSNPLLNLVDIAAICAVADECELLTIVDNTFLTPYFQQPLWLGADVVVHSTTKYLSGHCDVVGGTVVCKDAEMGEKVAELTNALGTCCSPLDAWLVLRGVRTLACRMEAHAKNAMALAEYLGQRPEVSRVFYPGLKSHPQYDLACRQMSGFGGMLSLEFRDGRDAALQFIMGLERFAFAESLGAVVSLIEHPETMSHASISAEARQAAGITAGMVRVSVGIETTDDLVADMTQAIDKLPSR